MEAVFIVNCCLDKKSVFHSLHRPAFLSYLPQYAPAGEGWSFTCQHGDDECRGNMIHACAKDHFNDINLEMEFVNCLLSADYPPNAGAKVATDREDLMVDELSLIAS